MQVAGRLGDAKVESAACRAAGMKEAAEISCKGQAEGARLIADAQIAGAKEKARVAAEQNAIWERKVSLEVQVEETKMKVEEGRLALQSKEFRAGEIRRLAALFKEQDGLPLSDSLSKATEFYDQHISPKK